jgi:hypothetical protein
MKTFERPIFSETTEPIVINFFLIEELISEKVYGIYSILQLNKQSSYQLL